MKRIIAVAVFVAAPAAWADEVFLRGGGSIHGEVVQQTAASVVMEVGPGRMTLPMSRVERIIATTSDLSIYRSRAAGLAAGDVRGWIALARWAEDRELQTQSRDAYEHVVAFDPQNATANEALGRVRLAGQWVTAEESFRARGYVPFEGGWVTPEERSAALADRSAEARARQATAEAEARAREAEARAEAAEADARRAEAEGSVNGIPYPYVYGSTGIYGGGIGYGPGTYGGNGRRGHGPRGAHQATPPPAPPPPPRSDNGATRNGQEQSAPTSRRIR